jgi:membrane-associated phospholipid phosphatase
MPALRRLQDRLLPKGGLDAARQVLLFVGAYILYQIVRGLVNRDDAPAVASWNATKIIDMERSLHVFIEPAIQHWALNFHWLMDIATWFYLNGNYAITGGALLWIYLRRNESFYFMRNMFLIAMLIALIGYTLYPTAPPRLMPEWGFTDVVQQITGVTAEHGSASEFLNLYAAIPSMHVCFAAMTGASMYRFSKLWAARLLWVLYAPFVAFVVIATGNHYLTDVVLGAATAGLSALLARELLARARPDAWAFSHAHDLRA